MKPNTKFLKQDLSFWAHVRTISQKVRYSVRNKGLVKSPTFSEMAQVLEDLGLKSTHIVTKKGNPTVLGNDLNGYFQHRAKVLNEYVEPRLMDLNRA